MTHLIVRLIHCLPGDLGGGVRRREQPPLYVSHARAHTRIHARAELQRVYLPAEVGMQ